MVWKQPLTLYPVKRRSGLRVVPVRLAVLKKADYWKSLERSFTRDFIEECKRRKAEEESAQVLKGEEESGKTTGE